MRPYTLASIVALLGMSIWHIVSIALDWPIWVGDWLVPLWFRFGLMLFTGGLAALLWQESFSFRHLMHHGAAFSLASLHVPWGKGQGPGSGY